MKVALLRTATHRERGRRRWDNLRLSIDIGSVRYGYRLTRPGNGMPLFMWSFHEHPGGQGGLEIPCHRDRVKEMVHNLIKHQISSDQEPQHGRMG